MTGCGGESQGPGKYSCAGDRLSWPVAGPSRPGQQLTAIGPVVT